MLLVAVAEAHSRGEPGSAGLAYLSSADDAAFVERLRAGDRMAIGALFDRYAEKVERTLHRVLGTDPEVPDLLQDVFVHAMASAPRFRGDAGSLAPWLTQIAVRTARKCIRRRTTRRWLGLSTPDELPETVAPEDVSVQATLRRAYALMGCMPARERIPFALRYVEGMQLAEVAEACEQSLATTKRYLARARARLDRLAARDPLLASWLEARDG